MAQREKAKEEKRARIREAAARIIRSEGIGKLTMRRLAEEAGVSLRTPYNLIGSKTDVLEIIHIVVNVKDELEKIKEQTLNIL